MNSELFIEAAYDLILTSGLYADLTNDEWDRLAGEWGVKAYELVSQFVEARQLGAEEQAVDELRLVLTKGRAA